MIISTFTIMIIDITKYICKFTNKLTKEKIYYLSTSSNVRLLVIRSDLMEV